MGSQQLVFGYFKSVILSQLLNRIYNWIMAAQTQGIQQLLAAEKRAAEKVSDARRRKNRLLKQAKEEAQQEIEKYKAEREKQFRDHEARFAGSKGDIIQKIEADTKGKISTMNQSVDTNQDRVIAGLIQEVCQIKPAFTRTIKAKYFLFLFESFERKKKCFL